jgi:hypothetical protein
MVGNNERALRGEAPEGYEPLVEVFLIGRQQPVPLAQVQTVRNPDFPWALLISVPEKDSPHEHLVFAREETIARVEIRLVRSDRRKSIGFSHHEFDDPSQISSDA